VKDLGIVLLVHVGFAWVAPGDTSNCLPIKLEKVCNDFPDIPIVAYHMGYPYCDDLNMQAAKYPNLYIGTSLLAGLTAGRPRQAQKMVGEAISWVGSEKLIWGTDWSGAMVRHKDQAAYVANFQISPQLTQDYGYPPLSEADKANWAGLNLARILKIKL
jgi:predicted TIM-barrel fold metal-dependent hydrolase